MFSPEATETVAWRDRALDRNLANARARSVARLERLVAAARELATELGTAGFTVQQVCAHAGVSLKGFYASFEGKDDLLVALLEEDSRIGAEILAGMVDAETDPEARLHAYVSGIFGLLTVPGALGYARVLVHEHRRLEEDRPDELRHALAPLLSLLAAELDAAGRAGVIAGTDPVRDAHTVFGLVLGGIHDVTLGRTEPLAEAEYLWRFCFDGLRRSTTSAPGKRLG